MVYNRYALPFCKYLNDYFQSEHAHQYNIESNHYSYTALLGTTSIFILRKSSHLYCFLCNQYKNTPAYTPLLTERLWQFPQNGSNPNGNFQLSVAYLGPLATLTSHLERLTPLTPADPHRVGSKFTHSQIYYIKNENKSTLVQIAIFISCSPRLKKNILLQLVSDLDWWTMVQVKKQVK